MFQSTQPAIAPGAIILVTGVSGFVGSHVADQLLDAGYKVRGTTRDATKNSWIAALFDKKYGKGKFELQTVSDLGQPGAFESVLEGVAGVIHIASDMTFGPDPNQVIPPMIMAAMNLASAAAKQPTITRFVFTSSCASAASPTPGLWRSIDRDSWNDDAVAQAWAAPPYSPERGFAVYAASKAQSERELWRWYKEQSPGFVLNTVLPAMNMGLSLDPVNQGHPSTSGLIEALFKGNIEAVKSAHQYFYIDVQDDARLHIAALLHPGIQNERVFAYGQPYTWASMRAELQKLYPGREFSSETIAGKMDRSDIELGPTAEGWLKEMGLPGYTLLQDTLRANTQDLV